MDAAELRAMQAPIKERYKSDPSAAVITLKAEGRIGEGRSKLLQEEIKMSVVARQITMELREALVTLTSAKEQFRISKDGLKAAVISILVSRTSSNVGSPGVPVRSWNARSAFSGTPRVSSMSCCTAVSSPGASQRASPQMRTNTARNES